MKKKICNHPGCNELIPLLERYCPQHKKEQPKPFSSAIRLSNDLKYHTTQWRKLRAKILKEQPNCFKCGSRINLEVHHIIPTRENKELFFDENSLVVVCRNCHRIITFREILNRKRNES
jgi:5-methylcytosine-specific restriction endonuclease McrA